jgi:TonB family protein
MRMGALLKAFFKATSMEPGSIRVISFLALGLAGCAQMATQADDVASLAGVYSSAHSVTIDGVKAWTNGYVEIDQRGRITALEQEDEGPSSAGSGCYRLAAGTATNAGLQGRMLKRGVSPRGDAVYQTVTANGDTFGILVEPAANGTMRWFFHSGHANSTVTINGTRNVVNSARESSYSISGPALASPTSAELRSMLCQAETTDLPHIKPDFVFHTQQLKANATPADQGAAAANDTVATGAVQRTPVPANAVDSPSPLAAGLPFELGKPVDTTAFAKLGIAPGSSKAKILTEWAHKLASDPDIKAYFSTPDKDPAAASALALSRVVGLLDGMRRISQQDREQLMDMSTRALDNAPADCGGAKNLQLVTSRYLSLTTESDEALHAQLQAIFDLFKQSTGNTPPPPITAAQRLQGQLALSTSIADALKRDASAADDLAKLMSGKQADLSPAAWCRATRIYRHAFDSTPQPARDWAMLAQLEDQRRVVVALVTMLKNVGSTSQTSGQAAVAPTVFDYAEMVRQRVRPHIVWNGKAVHGETVVEVHCTSAGNLESVKVTRSSGDKTWDAAAVTAVRQADPMPLDESGQAPRTFTITLRPGV